MRPNSSVGLGRRTRHRLAASLTAMALLATTAGAQDEAPRLVSHGAQGYSLDVNAIPPEERGVEALTALVTALVERQVRAAPEQWLWLHDRWRS